MTVTTPITLGCDIHMGGSLGGCAWSGGESRIFMRRVATCGCPRSRMALAALCCCHQRSPAPGMTCQLDGGRCREAAAEDRRRDDRRRDDGSAVWLYPVL